MATPGAERQRRYKRHRAGDHSLCIPGRCVAVTPEVTPEVTPRGRHPEPQRPQLGRAGSELWREMMVDGPLPPLAMVLLLEACRIADRLDRLDGQLNGEDWLTFEVGDGAVTVQVDKALAESRQQATALKQLVGELRQFIGKGKSCGPGAGAPTQGGGGIADLTSRIAARRNDSTG